MYTMTRDKFSGDDADTRAGPPSDRMKSDRFPAGYRCIQGRNIPGFKLPPLDHSLPLSEILDWHLDHNPGHTYTVLASYGDEGDQNVVHITYREFGEAVHKLGRVYQEAISKHAVTNGKDKPLDKDGNPPVVAVLAQVDTLIYCTVLWALWRVGYTPFPLSTRNSTPALKHLIQSTNTHFLVGSKGSESDIVPSSAIELLTKEVLEGCRSEEAESYDIHLLSILPLEVLYPRLAKMPIGAFIPDHSFEPLPALRSLPANQEDRAFSLKTTVPSTSPSLDTPSIIIHTSGSTRFPNPIFLSQRLLIHWGSWAWFGDYDMGGVVLGDGLALPSFHAIGVGSQAVGPFVTGSICAMWIPGRAPPFPSAESLLEGVLKTNSKFVLVVPDHVESWSRNPAAMEKLRGQLTGIVAGGGPCSKPAGDKLVENGVNIQVAYGTTEGGILTRTFRKDFVGQDWQYVFLSSAMQHRLEPEGDGLYRLIIQETGSYIPGVEHGRTADGRREYDTRDLLEEHPGKKGLYRIAGRSDDQIVMANGEKTYPVPIEGMISGHPLVRSAIMFGRGSQGSGVIIEPSFSPSSPLPAFSSSPSSLLTSPSKSKSEYISTIWPTIEQANRSSPTHSRIFKQLVIIADTRPEEEGGKPFPRTVKSTPIRGMVIKLYKEEIEDAYREFSLDGSTANGGGPQVGGYGDGGKEGGGMEGMPIPEKWDSATLREYVQSVVQSIMRPISGSGEDDGASIDPARDLFEQGCDSVQATFIRNNLKIGLYSSKHFTVPVESINEAFPPNIIFENPTITLLSKKIERTLLIPSDRSNVNGAAQYIQYTNGSRCQDEDDIDLDTHAREMRVMLDNYTRDMPGISHTPLQTEPSSPTRRKASTSWFSWLRGILARSYTPPFLPTSRSALLRSSSSSPPQSGKPKPKTVLLTGSTGALGSYILEQLILSPSIGRVWALNRPGKKSTPTILERQVKAFQDRGIDEALLRSENLRLLEGDVSKERFGLEGDVWDEVHSSTDLVIHNAWKLDFNLRLSSFEAHIRGVRNLIDFAASSHLLHRSNSKSSSSVEAKQPPHIFFTSSISTVARYSKFNGDHKSGMVPEEENDDPRCVGGSGYAESKWVSERILSIAAQNGIPCTTLRLGQLSGSARNGAWNASDWFPHIVTSVRSGVLDVLPVFEVGKGGRDLEVSWLGVDLAAKAVLDLALFDPSSELEKRKTDTKHSVYHIVHPRPTSWNTIIKHVKQTLERDMNKRIELISFDSWLDSLRKLARDPDPDAIQRAPIIKLLPFFEDAIRAQAPQAQGSEGQLEGETRAKGAMGFPRLDTARALEKSETLRCAEGIGHGDVVKWIEYWG